MMSSMSTFVLAPAPPPRRRRAAAAAAAAAGPAAAPCPPSSMANARRRSRSGSYLGRRNSLPFTSPISFLDLVDTPSPYTPAPAARVGVQGPTPAAALNALGYSSAFGTAAAPPLRLVPTTYSPSKNTSSPSSPYTAVSLGTPATPGDVAFDRERAAWASMLAEFRFARREGAVSGEIVEEERAMLSPAQGHTRNNSAVDPIIPFEDCPLTPPPRASSRQALAPLNDAGVTSFSYTNVRPRPFKRFRRRPSLAIVIAPLPQTNQIATNSPTPAMKFTFAPASAVKPLPQLPVYRSQKQEDKGETEEIENVVPSVAFVPAFRPRRPSVLQTYARFANFRNKSLSTLFGMNDQERI